MLIALKPSHVLLLVICMLTGCQTCTHAMPSFAPRPWLRPGLEALAQVHVQDWLHCLLYTLLISCLIIFMCRDMAGPLSAYDMEVRLSALHACLCPDHATVNLTGPCTKQQGRAATPYVAHSCNKSVCGDSQKQPLLLVKAADWSLLL